MCMVVAVLTGLWVKDATNNKIVGLGAVLLVCWLGEVVYHRIARNRR